MYIRNPWSQVKMLDLVLGPSTCSMHVAMSFDVLYTYVSSWWFEHAFSQQSDPNVPFLTQEVNLHMHVKHIRMHVAFQQFISAATFSTLSCSWLSFVRSYVYV